MFESRLAGAGVDLVLRGGRELGSKGVVEGHRVVEVSQLAAVRLLLPLPYVYIWRDRERKLVWSCGVQ